MRKRFYVLRKHRKDCWQFNGKNDSSSVWVCPEVRDADPRQDKTKPRRFSTEREYLVYRCNMPNCEAELAVSLNHVAEVLSVNGEFRTLGQKRIESA